MKDIVEYFFWLGVDFCINMANLIGIPYDVFNVWLFFVVLPSIILILLALNIFKPFLKRAVSK